jgi:hypothetical protein
MEESVCIIWLGNEDVLRQLCKFEFYFVKLIYLRFDRQRCYLLLFHLQSCMYVDSFVMCTFPLVSMCIMEVVSTFLTWTVS